MNAGSSITRVLIVHPDPDVRQNFESLLRDGKPESISTFVSASLSDTLEQAKRLDPQAILLNLSESRDLALDVASDLRRNGRLVIGLYTPSLIGDREAELLRAATRNGVSDFITLPASPEEVKTALSMALLWSFRSTRPRESHLITFYSHKGGVGTTTLAVNTAYALASASSEDVAVCDADLQFGTAASTLAMPVDRDLCDMVRELGQQGPLEPYFLRDSASGLYMLAAPRNLVDAERVQPEDVSRTLISMRRRFNYSIVDTPSSLDLLTMSVFDLSERIYVVTEPSLSTVQHTVRALHLLAEEGFQKDRVRVILNRAGASESSLSEAAVEEELKQELDVVVRFDGRVLDAMNRGEVLIGSRSKSTFARSITELSESILQEFAATPVIEH